MTYKSHILTYQKQQQQRLQFRVLLSLTSIRIFNPLAYSLQLFVRSYVKADCGLALSMCDVCQTEYTIICQQSFVDRRAQLKSTSN